MADEQLSSQATGFLQIVVWAIPAVAVFNVLFAVVMLGQPIAAVTAFPALLIAWFLIPFVRQCRHVVATASGLQVGSGDAAFTVPYTAITKVTTFRWSNPKVITVETADNKIRFFAALAAAGGWSEPPAARMLRERAGLTA